MNKNLRLFLKYGFSFAMVAMLYLHTDAKENRFVLPLYDSVLNDNNPNNLATAKLIECYPNPATTFINFKFDKSVAHTSKLYIYSFTGKQMNVLSITDNIMKISLDNYYRGLYMFQLRDQNGNILESGKFQVRN